MQKRGGNVLALLIIILVLFILIFCFEYIPKITGLTAGQPPESCVENWQCDSWSPCVNSQQTRTCTDLNNCGTTASKPATSHSCIPCIENWQCSYWSSCVNSQQTRTCTDSSNCGTTASKPATSQTCGCTDSDNGKVYDVKGDIKINGVLANTDSCYENGPVSETSVGSGYLFEFYCSGESYVEQDIVVKPGEKCSFGRIITVCNELWSCTPWSSCVNSQQTRTCTDSNNCNTTASKPAISQSCASACTENWQCDSWSSCVNSQQTRTCTDSNNCNTIKNKPSASKTCALQQEEKTGSIKEPEKQLTDKPPSLPPVSEASPQIKNEKIDIEMGKDVSLIKSGDITITTDLIVSVKSSKVYVYTSAGEKEIQISPKEAIIKSGQIDNINEIKIIDEDGEASYLIKGTKSAAILGIFPVMVETNIKISAETGEITETKVPWWSVLAVRK